MRYNYPLRRRRQHLEPTTIFDAHFHIIDPRYPLIANDGYLPNTFTTADYRRQTDNMGITGGAVVSGSFQGFDQDYLTTALAELGPGYVGVTQLPADTPDARILELSTNGVRAVRFNLRRGGSEDIQHLDRIARRVHELAGWHTELYVDSSALEDLYEVLRQLPQICIDHLGLSADGFATLIKLAEGGARIKATGFGRVDFDIPDALRAIDTANPNSLMFGTDLPSTRAPRPFSTADTQLIETTLGPERYAAVMHDNAAALYRP